MPQVRYPALTLNLGAGTLPACPRTCCQPINLTLLLTQLTYCPLPSRGQLYICGPALPLPVTCSPPPFQLPIADLRSSTRVFFCFLLLLLLLLYHYRTVFTLLLLLPRFVSSRLVWYNLDVVRSTYPVPSEPESSAQRCRPVITVFHCLSALTTPRVCQPHTGR